MELTEVQHSENQEQIEEDKINEDFSITLANVLQNQANSLIQQETNEEPMKPTFKNSESDPGIRSVAKTFIQSCFHIPAPKQIQLKVAEYWKKSKWMPPPVINLTIIIIQIIIYSIDSADPTERLTRANEFSPAYKKNIWRYYTYSLVHTSWRHVLGNSVGQMIFGTALEPLHGYRVALIFVIGVFAGSLAAAVLEYSTSLLGSSGGLYALIFAWISDIFLNWSEQQCPIICLMPAFSILIWDLIRAKDIQSGISVPAHASGGISGILAGMILLKNIKENCFQRITRKIAIGLFVAYFSILILMNVFVVHFD